MEAAIVLLREKGMAQAPRSAPAARRPRASSATGSPTTARRARWSRSAARPSRSRRTTSSRRSRRRCSTLSTPDGVDAHAELEDGAHRAGCASSARTSPSRVRPASKPSTAALIAAYAHPPANKLGVLLQLRGGDAELGRKVAMHIAAANPQWIDRDDVPADAVARSARSTRTPTRCSRSRSRRVRRSSTACSASASSARTSSSTRSGSTTPEDGRAGAEGGRRGSAGVPALLARRLTPMTRAS